MDERGPAFLCPTGGSSIQLVSANLIGRSPECHVVLAGQKVSRRHAHIYKLEESYFLADSQSNNGTYHNGARIMHPTKLMHGDVLRIGDHEFTFVESEFGAIRPAGGFTVTGERTDPNIRQVPSWMMVADIKNSTELCQRKAPAEYAVLVGDWFRKCRQLIENAHGLVNKSTGDGLLAYWLEENGDRAASIMKAARELQAFQTQSAIPFRCIWHYGVIGVGGNARVSEEALSGREVHFLFRIEQGMDRSLAMAFSRQAAERLQPISSMRQIGLVPLKGFEEDSAIFLPENF